MDAMRSMIRRSLLAVALLLLAPILGGCGTNLEQVLYQVLTATGRTAVDIALTDLANNVADRFEEDQTPDDGDGDGDGGDGDGDNGDGDNGDGGDTPTGAELFADNCASCHGADGASGFAPDISGMTAAELLAGLESGTHAAIVLSDEEVGLIAGFLGGTDSGDGGGTGDGAALYADNCAACHGADGASGFAPDISGMAVGELLAGLESGTHAAIVLSDEEVGLIADFLGGSDSGDGGGTGDGATLFADNCAACHGADGASGFAPDISGMAAGDLLAGLESATHASIMLSNEEVGLIADFLGGSGGGPTLDGAAIFADNCAACHGADGASGFAPNIRGFTAEQLMNRPDGHVPVTVTNEEIAAISAFLGGP